VGLWNRTGSSTSCAKLLGFEMTRWFLLAWLVWPFTSVAFAQTVSSAEPPPLAAKFVVSSESLAQPQTWYLFRDAQRIALLKPEMDEIWHRDAQGRIRFERVFHADRQTVDYSAGELITLGVQANWAALGSFMDPQELAKLKQVSTSGRGANSKQHLQGRYGGHGGQTLQVQWLPALQLPALIARQNKTGRSRITLVEQSATAPSHWPQPGQRSADYLHFDAADFGDMPYESVVRKSEAIDIRAGWRVAHGHETAHK
jgi:hypothetical protein